MIKRFHVKIVLEQACKIKTATSGKIAKLCLFLDFQIRNSKTKVTRLRKKNNNLVFCSISGCDLSKEKQISK